MSTSRMTKLERLQLDIARSILGQFGIDFNILNGSPKKIEFGPRRFTILHASKNRRYLINWETQLRRAAQSLLLS